MQTETNITTQTETRQPTVTVGGHTLTIAEAQAAGAAAKAAIEEMNWGANAGRVWVERGGSLWIHDGTRIAEYAVRAFAAREMSETEVLQLRGLIPEIDLRIAKLRGEA